MIPAKVSIIIPCYNAGPWLSASLESALAQTGVTTEVIVVDDGSKDNSLEIAKSFVPRGVIILTQSNAGAAAARNHGLRQAKGDYIQFLDADDLLATDKIKQQLERLQHEPTGFMASAAWARFRSSPDEAVFATEPQWRNQSGMEFQIRQLREDWMMPPICWLTPREVIERAGPWNESLTLNDDGEYFCRVMLQSAGIVFCEGARCYYRSGQASSLSRRRDARSLRSQQQSIELIIQHVTSMDSSPRAQEAIADGWQMLAYELHPTLAAEATKAHQMALAAGGSARRILGGRLVQWTNRFLGWRAAARVKHWTQGR